MSRRPAVIAIAALALLAAFCGVLVFREQPPLRRAVLFEAPAALSVPEAVRGRESPPQTVPVPPPLTGRSAPPAALPSAPPDSALPPPLDERALMEKLRELRGSDPELTLRLAREGNERFKGDADAAERAWFVVRALSDLGRHDEAKLAGRELLREYRGSEWAEDVYRHLFVNPGTHPAERGYGKQFELE